MKKRKMVLVSLLVMIIVGFIISYCIVDNCDFYHAATQNNIDKEHIEESRDIIVEHEIYTDYVSQDKIVNSPFDKSTVKPIKPM
ncbi:MAG: hypothetical protein E7281_05875 [Lachnospiraceae bacterium]|nr:hypothetical protein [Lachnospiraceae bacterium]